MSLSQVGAREKQRQRSNHYTYKKTGGICMRTLLLIVVVLATVQLAQARELALDPDETNAEAGTPIAGGSDAIASEPTPIDASAQVVSQAPAPAARKSVGTTVLLWLLIPGGGNFYNGATGKGFAELGGTIGGLALMATSMREYCEVQLRFAYCEDQISPGQFWGGFGTVVGFRVWGLVSAIHRTQDINSGKINPLAHVRFTVPTKRDGFKVTYSRSF
jgi:hypothetical protein